MRLIVFKTIESILVWQIKNAVSWPVRITMRNFTGNYSARQLPMTTKSLPPEVCAFLKNYFDKIYIITLRRAHDRHAMFKRLLSGLDYEIFWAVDKQDLNRADLIRRGVYDDTTARHPRYRHVEGLSEGQIACSLSHRQLHEKIVREGYDRVLMFEDDVVPVFEQLHQLADTLRQLPDNWELLYLGYTKNEEINLRQKVKQQFYKLTSPFGLLRWTPGEAARYLPRPYSANLRTAGLHDCTHAYAVSGRAAEKLVKAQHPVIAIIDAMISILVLNGELNAFVTLPKFFDQQGPSYIG